MTLLHRIVNLIHTHTQAYAAWWNISYILRKHLLERNYNNFVIVLQQQNLLACYRVLYICLPFSLVIIQLEVIQHYMITSILHKP